MGSERAVEQWSSADREARFIPPPRPDWVAKVNTEGSYMDLRSIVPLDERSLLDAAMANTGLDYFGDDDWREPFQILVKSLDTESQLNLMGRLMTRSDLLIMLEARLQIEATYRQHPSIEDEEIVKPLIIVGQSRTGTSALQNLLSADPANGTARMWEAMFPCPPPEKATYMTDPRIERADKLLTMWNRVTPEITGMHEINALMPTENIQLDCLGFLAPGWFNPFQGQVPSYNQYMEKRDPADVYYYQKRVLKLLQWRNPRRTWIMKCPGMLQKLPIVLKAYPDAGFIWTHRDPIRALASVVNLLGTLYYVRSDEPFIGDVGAHFSRADLNAGMLSKPIDWLEDGSLPKERLCNIRYRDFVRDPFAVVAKIYAYFGIELTPEGRVGLRTYTQDNPRSSRPSHDYEVGSATDINMERRAFAKYQKYFEVDDELFI